MFQPFLSTQTRKFALSVVERAKGQYVRFVYSQDQLSILATHHVGKTKKPGDKQIHLG